MFGTVTPLLEKLPEEERLNLPLTLVELRALMCDKVKSSCRCKPTAALPLVSALPQTNLCIHCLHF